MFNHLQIGFSNKRKSPQEHNSDVSISMNMTMSQLTLNSLSYLPSPTWKSKEIYV